MNSRIPAYGSALLQALRFSSQDHRGLQHLNNEEWKELLRFCDVSQTTLLVGHLCRPVLPEWVQARIDRSYSDNACRFQRLKAAVRNISKSLQERGIDFTLLKGFTHSQYFSPDPRLRAQGDIDIWCRPEQVFQARDVLLELQYRPIRKSKGRHLDPMIQETTWEWNGDYFAPDLPIPVDLHYHLWDQEMERMPGPREDEFWNRRCLVPAEGQQLPVLHLADALGFAAIHVLMHLLHGDCRLQRSWELAYFLQNSANDEEFWSNWQKLHSPELQKLEILTFMLVVQWFGCQLPDLMKAKAESLPSDLLLWIRHFGFSPLESLFVPNKSELWLNLCLLQSFRDKAHVLSRRLLPIHFAHLKSASHREHGKVNALQTLIKRSRHHGSLLLSTCVQGLHWRQLTRRIER